MPKENIYLKFWGTRGSLPTTGKRYEKCGGNTSCVEMRAGDNIIIFDAGSGIRELGESLLAEMPVTAHIFFTHYHWDHIMGLPFFTPLFIPKNNFFIYGETKDGWTVKRVIEEQMVFPYFPVKFKDVANATVKFKTVRPNQTIKLEDAVVKTYRLKHPFACLGFSVERRDSKVVHLTDIEHTNELDEGLVKFCQNADALIYDSAYTPEEYESKKGWGHSTYEEACKLANAAKVKTLYLFHHEPTHSDEFMEGILKEAKKLFKNSALSRDRLGKWF